MVNTDQLGMLLGLILYARPFDQSAFASTKPIVTPDTGIPDDQLSRYNKFPTLESRLKSMPLRIYRPPGPTVGVFSASTAAY
jgi:hypothetical protein